MTPGWIRLVRALVRRAALDDLSAALTAAGYAARLLRLVLLAPGDREVAAALGSALDEVRAAVRRLG